MEQEKKHRVQLTKEQKRAAAQRSSDIAFADEERRRQEARLKSERLRSLREANKTPNRP